MKSINIVVKEKNSSSSYTVIYNGRIYNLLNSVDCDFLDEEETCFLTNRRSCSGNIIISLYKPDDKLLIFKEKSVDFSVEGRMDYINNFHSKYRIDFIDSVGGAIIVTVSEKEDYDNPQKIRDQFCIIYRFDDLERIQKDVLSIISGNASPDLKITNLEVPVSELTNKGISKKVDIYKIYSPYGKTYKYIDKKIGDRGLLVPPSPFLDHKDISRLDVLYENTAKYKKGITYKLNFCNKINCRIYQNDYLAYKTKFYVLEHGQIKKEITSPLVTEKNFSDYYNEEEVSLLYADNDMNIFKAYKYDWVDEDEYDSNSPVVFKKIRAVYFGFAIDADGDVVEYEIRQGDHDHLYGDKVNNTKDAIQAIRLNLIKIVYNNVVYNQKVARKCLDEAFEFERKGLSLLEFRNSNGDREVTIQDARKASCCNPGIERFLEANKDIKNKVTTVGYLYDNHIEKVTRYSSYIRRILISMQQNNY